MTAPGTIDRQIPIAVNFHLWPRCNLKCTFCYAGFPNARQVLNTADCQAIITALASEGTEKITFVGGEPTLRPDLDNLICHAASLGLTTCVVTNGARLLPLLSRVGSALHWVGLSVDSPCEITQKALGRGNGDHVNCSYQLADELHARGIRVKLNSVITRLNWTQDLAPMVRRIAPDRWKALQVLLVYGENEDKVGPLLISRQEFDDFRTRHAALAAEGLGAICEDNQAMYGSYVMIDPQGCFFTNEDARYQISKPILQVGVQAALADVSWSKGKFEARQGFYDWRPAR